MVNIMSKKLTGVEGVDFVVCAICGERFKCIGGPHLKRAHGLTSKEYINLYPDSKLYTDKYIKNQRTKGKEVMNDPEIFNDIKLKRDKYWKNYYDNPKLMEEKSQLIKDVRWKDHIKENEIPDGKVECLICHKYYNKLSGNHLKWCHGLTKKEYLEIFPDAEIISDTAINNYSESKIDDKHPMNVPENRNKNRKIVSLARKQYYIDHPEERIKQGERSRQYYIDYPEARDIAREKSIEQWSNQEARDELGKRVSAGHQGILYEEWDHFLCDEDNWRDWYNATYLNKWFKGCHRHHITKTLVIHIPAELHGHISHNLKTGRGMAEINMLALQFINGCYDD